MKTYAPEILAPVATFEMYKAAVHNGADAIYIGMPHFNARGRTKDFSLGELKEIIEYCHLYGVKVFLAFNILIFEDEIGKVIELLKEVIPLSPDAFIVQDIGLVRLIKALAPSQEVHASTQMTITSSEAIKVTSDLRMSRYVLGREVSLEEMKQIKNSSKTELEVFVHGALCVSYSGQCLTSERIGGRSANRGQCAQSCRLPYDLIVDGIKKELGSKRHLVSPQDLCALDDVEKLIEIGIDSFKIEGRLKTAEYVASTVRAYKEKSISGAHSSQQSNLETIYSRGFFNGWMDGVNHQKLVPATYSNHHGAKIGNIINIGKDNVVISPTHQISPGDGLVFCDFNKNFEIGANIYSVEKSSEGTKLFFANKFDLRKLSLDMEVFCNSSPKLEKEIQKSFLDKDNQKKIAVFGELKGEIGAPLVLELNDGSGNSAVSVSDDKLQAANNCPISETFIREELASLGGTPFYLAELNISISDKSYIHQRQLKELRQKASKELIEKRSKPPGASLVSNFELTALRNNLNKEKVAAKRARLNVLIRDKIQIAALTNLPRAIVYLDFEFGKEYAEALEEVRDLGHETAIATTRILKPGENGHLRQIIRLNPDYILVRNLGALEYLKSVSSKLVSDFSLNATNSLTVDWLLNKGISTYTPSYDLNQVQLFNLLAETGGENAEITIHQYMPAFHMEHCVFAAFLSNGTSFRDCGRPCEKHKVQLRDESGALHPLKADAECRNTMFHGVPQSAARLLPELLNYGVKNFRVEALYETSSELRRKLEIYLSYLNGTIDPESLLDSLNIVEKYGISDGQLLKIGHFKDRKKEKKNVTF